MKKICLLVTIVVISFLFACENEETKTLDMLEEQKIYLPEVEIEGFTNEDYLEIVNIVKGFRTILPQTAQIDPVYSSLDSLIYYTSKKNISFYEVEVTNKFVYMAIYSDETSDLSNFENVIFLFDKEGDFSKKFLDKEIFAIFLIQPLMVIRDCIFGKMTNEKTFYFTRNIKYKIPVGEYLIPLRRNDHKSFINYVGEYRIFEMLIESNIIYFKHPMYTTLNENGDISYSGRFSLYPELNNLLQYSEKYYLEEQCGLINLGDFIKFVNSLIEEPE